ncbi:MAG TPA: response regulator [Acidobacteriota bacterium]|nr:response regulator [Acidobacteriota bacterium]HQM64794.1 response regulator [Acidobacteriota bacterium]
MQQPKHTILVIDDDIDFAQQLQISLKAAGFGVRIAFGEQEAEQALREGRPDLVISDLMMEHMDGGFVLCHRIKQQDPTIPVILTTAVTSATGMRFDTISADERAWVKADAILAKPVRFEQIIREIRRLLPEA